MKNTRYTMELVMAAVLCWLCAINLGVLAYGGQEWLNANWEWGAVCSAPNAWFFVAAMIGGIMMGAYGVYRAFNNLSKEESK